MWAPRRPSAFVLGLAAAHSSPNDIPAAERLAQRQAHVAPIVTELDAWMCTERAKLSRHADVAMTMDYMLKRWPAFTRFLEDGRICMPGGLFRPVAGPPPSPRGQSGIAEQFPRFRCGTMPMAITDRQPWYHLDSDHLVLERALTHGTRGPAAAEQQVLTAHKNLGDRRPTIPRL